MKTKICIPLSN